MMLKNIEEIKKKTNWIGTGIESRKILLSTIYAQCPSSNVLGPGRLEKIIKQSKNYEIVSCKHHHKLDKNYSLIQKHECKLAEMPIKVI